MKMLDKILELVTSRGLTHDELEVRAELAQGRISRWKSGKGEPSVAQAVRMARVLGVSVGYLVDDAQTDPTGVGLSEDERLILANARHLGYRQALDRLLGLDQQSAASREGSRGLDVGLGNPGSGRLPDPPAASGKTGRNSG